MHGYGRWFSQSGDEYIGQFIKNKKHGWGIYKWKNGNIYEGYFKNGMQALVTPERR